MESKKYYHLKKVLSVLCFVFSLVFVAVNLSACSNDESTAKGSEKNPVTIGVVGASEPQWSIFKEKAKEQGIYVDIKDFAEYTEPNPALSQGQLDMNEFQHILFLANYNIQASQKLVPIGATAVYPISLYGNTEKSIKSLKSLPKDAKIAIPNDGTNQSRALYLLQSVGLILFKSGHDGDIVTPFDVNTKVSKVKVVPVSAAETAANITDPSISAAVVNNDFVKNLSDADKNNILYTEKADSDGAKPYINVWAVNEKDQDNEVYKKIVKLFAQDSDIKKALAESVGGENKLVFTGEYTKDELVKILKSQEEIVSKADN